MGGIKTATDGFASLLLRGGRITKWKGQAASCAPHSAAITASSSALAISIALASGLLSPDPARAGSCVETAPGSGQFLCSGAASPTDVSQGVIRTTPGDVVFTTLPGFGLQAGSFPLTIRHQSTGDLTFIDANESSITAISVSSNSAALDMRNLGSGSITVSSNGTLRSTSTRGHGIDAVTYAASGSISVTSFDTEGGFAGIRVASRGTGSATINSYGTARSTYFGYGIVGSVSAGGQNLTINAVDAYGQSAGIRADNFGSGAISITSTGNVVGNFGGYFGSGITVRNAASATSIDITANNATGGARGINVVGAGRGPVSITSTGQVIGLTDDGINASSAASNLDITAHHVSGGRYGIFAVANGPSGTSGDITITTSGDVTGISNTGINARQYLNGDVTISAANVAGRNGGITVNKVNTGSISIAATGEVSSSQGSGIIAYNNDVFSGTVSIDVASVHARTTGISALVNGTGSLSISSTGDVVALVEDGIYARNIGDATDITAVNVAGGTNGLRVVHQPSSSPGTVGALAITVTGAVEGGSGYGLYAFSNGTDTTISTRTVTGGLTGIAVNNYGTGALSITTTGATSGTLYDGIKAQNNSYGGATSLSITTGGATTGGEDGIDARNYGTAGLTITANADVTGETGMGIRAFNSVNDVTASMLITQAAGTTTQGGINGIDADNAGGSLTINALGTSIGDTGSGIYAVTQSTATSLSVTANNASGAVSGIETRSYGSGGASITLTGTAQGGTGAAIDTYTEAGDPLASGAAVLTTITLAAGSQALAGSSGIAIRNNEGNSLVNVAGTLGGDVRLGDGSDVLNIGTSTTLQAGIVLDGGDDLSSADGMIDILNFNGWSGSVVGGNTINWEVININGGTVGVSDAAITTGVININGGGRLNGSNSLVVTGNVAVGTGSSLVAGTATGTNAMVISGTLTNAGTVTLRSLSGASAAGDRLTIGGNYTGTPGSTVHFDTVLGGSNATDLMVVRGNFGGTSTALVSNVGGTGALTSGDGIRLVQVDGTSSAGALTLAGGRIDVGAFRYELFNGGVANPNDQDWYLRSRTRDIVLPTLSMARVAQTIGLVSLGTLHERVGEQEHLGLQSTDSGFLKGMWGRLLGRDYSETARSSAFGDSRSNGQMGGLQMGIDLYRGVSSSGARTHVGVFGGHLWSGTADFGVTPMAGLRGRTRSDGWVLGGYVTHYTSSGWYVDAVAQLDWLDHRLTAEDGTSGGTRSRGFVGSVEVGKAFGSKWKLEPQLQLIYGNTDLNDFSDTANVANRISIEDSLTGRAGFRLKRTWDYDKASDGGLFTFYAKANVWGRLDGGQTRITVGPSAPGEVQFKEVWGDVGLGSTFSISKTAELFFDADVEYGIDQGATAMSARGGMRIRF